jgi:hypothetical protein
MNRRRFVSAGAAAGLAAAAPADAPKNNFYHLLYFYLRPGSQVDRTTQYLRDVFLPAARRNGMGPSGFFSPVIGERSPFILALVSYPSWASVETVQEKFAADKEFQKGWDDYNKYSGSRLHPHGERPPPRLRRYPIHRDSGRRRPPRRPHVRTPHL